MTSLKEVVLKQTFIRVIIIFTSGAATPTKKVFGCMFYNA